MAEQAGFNIQRFKSEIDKRGIQKNNKFLLSFYPSQFMRSQAGLESVQDITTAMQYWCEGATLPGVQLAMRQVLRYGYGPIEKKPFAPVFNDITFTFIGDGGGINIGFFQTWINTVNMFYVGANNPIAGTTGIAPFELFYKEDYMVDMRVTAFNDVGDETTKIVLREAYPFTIQDLPLNWADNNTVMKVPITFVFHDWYYEKPIERPRPVVEPPSPEPLK